MLLALAWEALAVVPDEGVVVRNVEVALGVGRAVVPLLEQFFGVLAEVEEAAVSVVAATVTKILITYLPFTSITTENFRFPFLVIIQKITII